MLDIMDHLRIVHDTFLVTEIRLSLGMYRTQCLHRNVWDQTDRYRLEAGKYWDKKYAYYYFWGSSGWFDRSAPYDQKPRSAHDWDGPFESPQEAFADAYAHFGPMSPPGSPRICDEWWEAWKRYAARMGLVIPDFGEGVGVRL
jgi:hypothetical protein